MGVSVNAQLTEDSEYVKAVDGICKIVAQRNYSVMARVEFLYRFTKLYQEEKRLLKILHDFTDKVVQKRRRDVQECVNTNNNDYDEFGIKHKRAFLDLLLDAKDGEGKPFSDNEIREQVDTFMFGVCTIFFQHYLKYVIKLLYCCLLYTASR